MTLYPNWGCLALPGVVPRSIRLLELKNISPEGFDEKVSYPHPSTRNCSDAENQIGSTYHLVSKLAGEFKSPLRAFTCVSAQQ